MSWIGPTFATFPQCTYPSETRRWKSGSVHRTAFKRSEGNPTEHARLLPLRPEGPGGPEMKGG